MEANERRRARTSENRNLDDLCRYLLRGNIALAQCLAERLVIDRAVSCDYAEARRLISVSKRAKIEVR